MLFECKKKSRQIHVFYVEWQCNRTRNWRKKWWVVIELKFKRTQVIFLGNCQWIEWKLGDMLSNASLRSRRFRRTTWLALDIPDAISCAICCRTRLRSRFCKIGMLSLSPNRVRRSLIKVFILLSLSSALDWMTRILLNFAAVGDFNHFITNWLKYARGYHAGIITVDWFFDAFEICVCENSQRLAKASYGDMTWSTAKNIWSWMVVLGT